MQHCDPTAGREAIATGMTDAPRHVVEIRRWRTKRSLEVIAMAQQCTPQSGCRFGMRWCKNGWWSVLMSRQLHTDASRNQIHLHRTGTAATGVLRPKSPLVQPSCSRCCLHLSPPMPRTTRTATRASRRQRGLAPGAAITPDTAPPPVAVDYNDARAVVDPDQDLRGY